MTLGSHLLPEHRGRDAVVTAEFAEHCTVAILDSTGRTAAEECWPAFRDVSLRSSVGRVGSRIVISGLRAQRTSWCNGLTGVVVEHPREGHPCFVRKANAENDALLVFCVSLIDPPSGRPRRVMMEPRFLKIHEELLEQTMGDLGDCSLKCAPSQAVQVADIFPHGSADKQNATQVPLEQQTSDLGCSLKCAPSQADRVADTFPHSSAEQQNIALGAIEQKTIDLGKCSLKCALPQIEQVADTLPPVIAEKYGVSNDEGFGLATCLLSQTQFAKIGGVAALAADPLLVVQMMFRLLVGFCLQRSQRFSACARLRQIAAAFGRSTEFWGYHGASCRCS